jgi:hypothetical protein
MIRTPHLLSNFIKLIEVHPKIASQSPEFEIFNGSLRRLNQITHIIQQLPHLVGGWERSRWILVCVLLLQQQLPNPQNVPMVHNTVVLQNNFYSSIGENILEIQRSTCSIEHNYSSTYKRILIWMGETSANFLHRRSRQVKVDDVMQVVRN